jgi:uncharacterized protein
MSGEKKERRAIETLKRLGSVAVAFSGGVDSSLVCSLAKEALGEKAIAVIGKSPLDPAEELDEARRTAKAIGIRLFEVEVPVMSDESFVCNPADRCYHCKRLLFKAIRDLATKHDIVAIADGSTNDDLSDVRPGMRANREAGVRSPLLEVGISKEGVRAISKSRGLPTWTKPSGACLASRIPYGTSITAELLCRIGRVERFLRSNGFSQVRVRAHGEIARIEIGPKEMKRFMKKRDMIAKEFKEAGFTYVTLDIEGFRSGSMNEVL